MLRTVSSVFSQSPVIKTTNCSVGLEFVRWRRKPRWLPVAKSKLFRVPERKPQDEEEKAELLRLHNHYKTQMRSMRLFFREEVERNKKITSASHVFVTPEQEAAEHQQCLELNNTWNLQIAEERKQRLEQQVKARKETIQQQIKLAEERRQARKQFIEEIVRREKELSKTFITREKLDAAIETALANPVDYNFAIDREGNMYRGYSTTLEGPPEQITNNKTEIHA